MDKSEKIEAYYAKEHPFKTGIAALREMTLKTRLVEDFKWGFPVYTIENKNVLGILAFKTYFGLWFYNGVFLSDPKKVLKNAQKGKTKAMRHWKFTSEKGIDEAEVIGYIEEAITNQKKGRVLIPEKNREFTIASRLRAALKDDPLLNAKFKKLTPYKQKEYSEYITEAKQEKTKQSRLEKCIPLILKEMGLNDGYHKK